LLSLFAVAVAAALRAWAVSPRVLASPTVVSDAAGGSSIAAGVAPEVDSLPPPQAATSTQAPIARTVARDRIEEWDGVVESDRKVMQE
jgi:hypothetical protein